MTAEPFDFYRRYTAAEFAALPEDNTVGSDTAHNTTAAPTREAAVGVKGELSR